MGLTFLIWSGWCILDEAERCYVSSHGSVWFFARNSIISKTRLETLVFVFTLIEQTCSVSKAPLFVFHVSFDKIDH